MIGARRPPRLVIKAAGVTFTTAIVLLLVVFVLVRVTVRDSVRQTVLQNLDLGQRVAGAIEAQRRDDLRTQATTLAENPTLKAAVDTWAVETFSVDADSHEQLRATMQRELDKLAARVGTDAVSLSDVNGGTLAVAGRLGESWLRAGADATLLHEHVGTTSDPLVEAGSTLFRVVRVPLTVEEGTTVGWLHLGIALDDAYAGWLDNMSQVRTAIVREHELVASTLSPAQAVDFGLALRGRMTVSEPVVLGGASHALREITRVGDVRLFALSSIDAATAPALARVSRVLGALALGTCVLALLGSVWIARRLTGPIEQLSAELGQMAAARDLTRTLPATGSSLELDLLTTTFNQLITSVVDAEARTEAAYAGAIRALAAALDARDPYTAGHSERVSVLSVAIGQVLRLDEAELEVLRLGALLHDIGKIGISDDVLRKTGPLTDEEYGAIMEHPAVGARILRSIPFLHPHIDIVELHHERPDGGGYPKGLRGDDIPLLARIVHVADAYDAITSARAYRQARSSTDALRELWRYAGTEFHAEIVGALARALPQVASGPVPFELRRVAAGSDRRVSASA